MATGQREAPVTQGTVRLTLWVFTYSLQAADKRKGASDGLAPRPKPMGAGHIHFTCWEASCPQEPP